MPKKAKTPEREKAKWRGYVNFNPSVEEREAIRETILAPAQFERWISQLADDGYRVSFKHDTYRDSLVCEVYGQWEDSKNAGRTLVVAHNDVLVAASAVAWFHDNVAEDGVWPEQSHLNNPYSW